MSATEATTLSTELEVARIAVNYDRQRLAGHMRSLGERMIRIANNLERNPDTIISGNGEVQSQGSTIDALCGSYRAEQDWLRAMERLAQS